MKSVDTGKDKVKKICEVLKKETLDPAKKEADRIIAAARAEAEKIVENAKREGKRSIEDAKKKIEEEKSVFQASLNLAAKKSLDTLKHEVERKLFNEELDAFVGKQMNDPKVVAELIAAIVKGIEKEGLDTDLKGVISSAVSTEAVNKELIQGILDRLKGKSVEVGDIAGGAQVKIVDKNLTIDMTDEALKALLASFVRDDFRSVIFAASV